MRCTAIKAKRACRPPVCLYLQPTVHNLNPAPSTHPHLYHPRRLPHAAAVHHRQVRAQPAARAAGRRRRPLPAPHRLTARSAHQPFRGAFPLRLSQSFLPPRARPAAVAARITTAVLHQSTV